MRRRLATAVLVAVGAWGCGGSDTYTFQSGLYSKTTLDITEDLCNISSAVGTVQPNYGRLTVSDSQVTHTDQATFTSEVYTRTGNSVTRDAMPDIPATGSCVLSAIIHESGSLSANDRLDITHEEARMIKSGDCAGIPNVPCRSTFRYRLARTGS